MMMGIRQFLLVLLAFSLSGCSYTSSFLIANHTAHDLVVLYRFLPKAYGSLAFSTSPETWSAHRADGGYVLDSLVSQGSFTLRDTVRMVVPSDHVLRTSEIMGQRAMRSFEGIDRLMIVRTDLGDTLKIPGSMIADLTQELDGDAGLVIQQRPSDTGMWTAR